MSHNIKTNKMGRFEFVRLANSGQSWHEKYSVAEGGTEGRIYIAADELAAKAREFAAVGGLDFGTCVHPFRYGGGGTMVACEKDDCDMQVVTRCDTDERLSVVGNNWTPYQNKDGLANVQTVLDTGLAKMSTAFAINGGRTVVYCCELQGSTGEVVLGDEVKRYFTLAIHHKVGAIAPFFTTTRTVCENTLMAGMSDAIAMLRVRHSQHVTMNVQTAFEMINVAACEFQAELDQWKQLANIGFNQEDVAKYVMKVFQVEEGDKISTRQTTILSEIVKLASIGKGNKGKTLWDAFNAITEYETHHRGNSVSTRTDALLFGGENGRNIAKAKQVAFQIAGIAS